MEGHPESQEESAYGKSPEKPEQRTILPVEDDPALDPVVRLAFEIFGYGKGSGGLPEPVFHARGLKPLMSGSRMQPLPFQTLEGTLQVMPAARRP